MAPAEMKIGMLMLGVTDMGRAVAFYRDAVGLAVQFGSDEFTFLDGGGVTLALQARKELSASRRRPADGDRLRSRGHRCRATGSLRERGVAFRIEPRVVSGDGLAADFRDPDGHVLSIFGPRQEMAGDA